MNRGLILYTKLYYGFIVIYKINNYIYKFTKKCDLID